MTNLKEVAKNIGLIIWSVAILIIGFIIGPVLFLKGKIDLSSGSEDREFVLSALLLWGFLYAFIKIQLPKIWFASLQVVVALCGDWYQIGKLAQADALSKAGSTMTLYDRWVFILVGTAIIGAGLEKIMKELIKSRKLVTLQSSESSATLSTAQPNH